jgi:SNF2 family DNA or RNA helicase
MKTDVIQIDLLSGTPDTTEVPVDPGCATASLPVPSMEQGFLVRSFHQFKMSVSTVGWKFPPPVALAQLPAPVARRPPADRPRKVHRLRPPSDAVLFKERLFYVLQPPLENLLAGKQARLPAAPYPYQMEGVAFLMPRHAALLADEMGLGKTMQAILALRLLLQAGLVRRALIVCPKSLVSNWCREITVWAEDMPFEVVGGDGAVRRTSWLASSCPVKVVNYEILTRDEALLSDGKVEFDLVILDEAQRIKNRDSRTSQVARAIHRDRSWALTGTPIENHHDDLINLFAFIDEDRVPRGTSPKQLPGLTGASILRRTKDDVLDDLPAKAVRDAYLDLTPAQREAYELAEVEGVVRLNALGDTITVQHIFELVLRLKQICNFDPLTGASSKLEQLQADLAEVTDSGRKAILFSQWVEPLEVLAGKLGAFGPLLYHGRVPTQRRQNILDRFRNQASHRLLLMSYGTGSVGLNLQFANYVFLFDRWWNPAVEDQAINRVHRIGQRDPVFITRFLVRDTIEERIAQVLERKRRLFNDLIEDAPAPPSLGLSEEEIFGLFEIRARPKRHAA